tara:strand:- start:3146 stop:3961 length:816 start_codon:yes stop_codon:yes gene_type:complete
MAERVPLKGLFDGSGNVTGLAEFSQANSDVLGVIHGGTGLTTITANKILTGNGTSTMSVEANLTFDGSSNTLTTPNASITTAATLASAKVSDLTDNRVVVAGTAGELEDSGNLTFDGTTLTVTGNLSVSGTFQSVTQIQSFDPIMILNADYSGSSPADDVGILINRGGGSSPNVAIFWDEETDTVDFGLTTNTGGNEEISVSAQVPIKVGNITSTGNIQLTGTLQFDSGQTVSAISNDGTFTAGAATSLVTEGAIKSHVSAQASAFAIALG